MMKIAILTQPLGLNYGGLLQAYALQHALKELKAHVVTIDRRAPKLSTRKRIKTFFKNCKKYLSGKIKSFPSQRKDAYILEHLDSFIRDRISLSPCLRSSQDLIKYCRENDFDLFIVGSDQVWRPKYSPCIENFFLDFCDEIGSRSKRISYAASFGVDAWEYTEEQTLTCKSLISKFDAVSVRERSALVLCKKKLGIEAKLVVDPTMLLERSDYESLLPKQQNSRIKGKVISYLLDSSEEKSSIVESVAKLLNTDSLAVKPSQNYSQVKTSQIKSCQLPKVEEWLEGFFLAEFVVTDSFHGCVFAIIFNKPFIAIGNHARGLSRFESLLAAFGLEDRLIQSISDISLDLLGAKIDWDIVNKIKSNMADDGKAFLIQYVSK